MGLNQAQLDQLGRQLDNDSNALEILVLSAQEAEELTRDNHPYRLLTNGEFPLEASGTSGLLDPLGSYYNNSLHGFVNTSWGMPALLSAYDAAKFARFVRDMGGARTRIRYVSYNGGQYVVLSGYPGLRRRLTGTRYSVTSARLIQMGIGRYGIRGSSLSGFRLSCFVGVGAEFLEYLFNSQTTMLDLLGGIGVELVKAGIASAVGYAAAATAGTFLATAAIPIGVGAVVVLVVGIGLNVLDNRYDIKQHVKDSLHYAVDMKATLTERFQKLDSSKVKAHVERAIGEIIDAAVDQVANETKAWILRQLPSGLVPGVPFRLPSLNNFKLLKR